MTLLSDSKPSARTHLRPDSMMGACAAFEGIRGGVALVNAPSGCKFYPAWLLDHEDSLGSAMDPTEFNEKFFFGNQKVPTTALNGLDYIYGSKEKLTEALLLLDKKNYPLIGVVNGPGTSLIGDDLPAIIQSLNLKALTVPIESSGFTGSMAHGFQEATIKILKQLKPKKIEKKARSVNLIGFMLCQADWEHDIEELKRNLQLCGISVQTVLTANTRFESLTELFSAELNIVVKEEYGKQIAEYLKNEYGIPYLNLELLSPYGFDTCEIWISEICKFFGISPEPFRKYQNQLRKRGAKAVERLFTRTSLPRGVPFAIFGDSSQVASITYFLHGYLGMNPVSIGLYEMGENSCDFLETYLGKNSLKPHLLYSPDPRQIKTAVKETQPWIFFGSSFEFLLLEKCSLEKKPFFIGSSFPVWGKVKLTHRPQMGAAGNLTIIEEVLNALQRHSYASL